LLNCKATLLTKCERIHLDACGLKINDKLPVLVWHIILCILMKLNSTNYLYGWTHSVPLLSTYLFIFDRSLREAVNRFRVKASVGSANEGGSRNLAHSN